LQRYILTNTKKEFPPLSIFITVNGCKSFSGQNYISDPDKIVVRDTESERKIIEIFEAAEFLVDKNIIYLTDENKLFEFLRNDLPRLQELAEVYYSDAFKNISVRFPPSFSGGIRINQASNMLEFSLTTEILIKASLNIFFLP